VEEKMSSGPEFIMYVDAGLARRQEQKSRRFALALAFLCLGMVAAVALVSSQPSKSVEMTLSATAALSPSSGSITSLAQQLINSAPHATVDQMMQDLELWKSRVISSASDPEMLSMLPESAITSDLDESNKLCPKKDIIVGKLEALLQKLLNTNEARNSADQAAYEAMNAAAKQHLDIHAEYDLMETKLKQATEGATYAQSEYEKWAAILKNTKDQIKTSEAENAKERVDIAGEQAIINEILRLIGVLHGVGVEYATVRTELGCFLDKGDPRVLPEYQVVEGSAAGVDECEQVAKSRGYKGFCMEYNKECYTGPDFSNYDVNGPATNCVDGRGGGWALNCYEFTTSSVVVASSPTSKAAVLRQAQQKVSELKMKAMEPGSGLKAHQVEMLSTKLASYSESEEVKAILEQMLKELEDRLTEIMTSEAAARAEEVSHQAETTKYETDLVDLSNEKNHAKSELDKLALKKGQADADKVSTAETYKDEHAMYENTVPITNREIEIIREIITKIEGYCAPNASPTPFGSDWQRVRHVPAGNTWHPATDQLRGTSTYGTSGDDTTAWSTPFDFTTVSFFLFSTGDKQKWLVVSKDELMGEDGNLYYANELRTFLASSLGEGAKQARWYRRDGVLEDPWVSLTDHHDAIISGDMVYGGKGSVDHTSNTVAVHQGADVYITSKASNSTA
jgi:hypothetical protein